MRLTSFIAYPKKSAWPGASRRLLRPPDAAQLNAWKQGVVDQLTGGVQALLKRAGVRVIHGDAMVLDGKTVEVTMGQGQGTERERFVCQHLVLATGSAPAALPMLPFGGKVVSSTEALEIDRLPETLAIIGGGYIGVELGTVYAKLGANVTLIEAEDRVLPSWDSALTTPVQRRLGEFGVELLLGTRVVQGDADAGTLQLSGPNGEIRSLTAERILVATGRRPRSRESGIESLMLAMDGPFIRVDDRCHTSMRQVWAVGDITGPPRLAHRAMAQAEVVAASIAGRRRRYHTAAIPEVCYSDPEVVSVGLSPDDARATMADVVTASYPFSANGRALTLDAPEGLVRVVAKRDDHRIQGWQAVGPGVSELTAAFTHSIEMCSRLEDVVGTVHAHPTLSEAIQEVALKALGRGLHG